MEKSFFVKVIGRLGGDKPDARELRVLNRVLSWRSGGVQLEADPRHQEILISESEQGVRGLSTTGVKNPQRKDGDWVGDECLLDEAEAHSFAARQIDSRTGSARPCVRNQRIVQKDVVANECRQRRAPPGVPVFVIGLRLVYELPWQPEANLDVFVGTDFAGCLATRRSRLTQEYEPKWRSRHLSRHLAILNFKFPDDVMQRLNQFEREVRQYRAFTGKHIDEDTTGEITLEPLARSCNENHREFANHLVLDAHRLDSYNKILM